ncbi:expressed unknown protein [Seminavis robusta]|uniref:Uncharacterized protein n=1 Tax=Seminavis robusta TaxID=568900 RepID=A0A9N8HMY3_9STRA|nr:expressed unknown protein [Seminavis robusta]|eukprot:Sro781_g201610.1 n/a (155) ;mRNA; r:32610-33074
MDTDRTSFEGPVDQGDEIVGAHSLCLVGVCGDENDPKKIWYLLQNSWKGKQFVEVDNSYLESIADLNKVAGCGFGKLRISFPEPAKTREVPVTNSGFPRAAQYFESSPRESLCDEADMTTDCSDSENDLIVAVATGDTFEAPELVQASGLWNSV